MQNEQVEVCGAGGEGEEDWNECGLPYSRKELLRRKGSMTQVMVAKEWRGGTIR